MERTKLISIRLEKPILDAIDQYKTCHTYWSRSELINRILHAVMTCTPIDDFYRLISSHDPYGDGIMVQVSDKKNLR